MSTLEKTIGLLNDMSEEQIEFMYMCARFIDTHNSNVIKRKRTVDDVLKELTGSVPDSGKTIEEYKAERIADRYGVIN